MRHVLFDLDGTLTDSAPGITRCLEHAIRTVGGLPPSLDALRVHIGTPLAEIFATLIPEAGPSDLEAARAAYIERFDRAGLWENAVYPGVAEALDELGRQGFSLWVATAKGEDVARRVLEAFGLDRWFDGVFGARLEAGVHSKQQILERGLAAGRIPVSAATMVGDRHHDVDAALALGVRAVGVGWGYGSAEELARAHAIAPEPAALVRAIAEVAGG